ncbi:hypothetical protein [Salinarimonas ramus]|uniref:Uncharacterized protein n=1 Tax=Salinarimonas ramus TaxID=690164 RepID=A0A917V534_9HYPH|nr:hypothetical protein [Salinarimonas ramus]GGK38903.1 hypothetical protein GCM10011322_27480 [Salinarimonas ramus]
MVTPIYGGPTCVCKGPISIEAERAALTFAAPYTHPLLDLDDQAALLSAVADAGEISLADLACAIPGHPRPISAIWSLVTAGLLAADAEAPFDGDLQIWRPAR